jgi:hypothetical protein
VEIKSYLYINLLLKNNEFEINTLELEVLELIPLWFEGKIEKYLHTPGIAGNREQIIPSIISYSRILFRKSDALLDKLIEEIKPPMLYKVIYKEIAMAWKYAENLTLERMMSYLED